MDDSEVAAAYKVYGGAVFARCWRLLRDKDAAGDITQEVFLRCFGHRGSLRTGRELLGWLYRVATNLCLNAIRDESRRRQADRSGPDTPAVQPEGPRRQLLSDLMSELDERTQAIVVYVYLDGMTHAEAAEVAQVTDRTVRNCLTRFQERGRRRLETELAPLPKEECG
jgi:RNA polymerase sigma-70 factor (ECF subfamily)